MCGVLYHFSRRILLEQKHTAPPPSFPNHKSIPLKRSVQQQQQRRQGSQAHRRTRLSASPIRIIRPSQYTLTTCLHISYTTVSLRVWQHFRRTSLKESNIFWFLSGHPPTLSCRRHYHNDGDPKDTPNVSLILVLLITMRFSNHIRFSSPPPLLGLLQKSESQKLRDQKYTHCAASSPAAKVNFIHTVNRFQKAGVGCHNIILRPLLHKTLTTRTNLRNHKPTLTENSSPLGRDLINISTEMFNRQLHHSRGKCLNLQLLLHFHPTDDVSWPRGTKNDRPARRLQPD